MGIIQSPTTLDFRNNGLLWTGHWIKNLTGRVMKGGFLKKKEDMVGTLRKEAFEKLKAVAQSEREKDFTTFQDMFGFYDVFLMDAEGNVVYTVAKKSDLGADLKRGALKKTGRAQAPRLE